jgi:hypothetical protein
LRHRWDIPPTDITEADDANADEVAAQEAKHGERMIEIKVRFWTNDIAEGEGNILPKHAWTSGVVRMERNSSHGIVPDAPMPFHSLMDLSAVMEKVLHRDGVQLHPSRRMKKYLAE